MKKIIEQIEAMGLGEDKALAEAIDSADSVEKLISVLRERGIEATAEQLTGLKEGGEDGELTEEALENVGGGWFGFFAGMRTA
jgi:predicted ribosomally synthesized peptide with nif11-like leader